MAEVKIADQNMYGYRVTGPHEPRTQVRVIAGQQIPPDLVDLEPMPKEDDPSNVALYPEVTSALMTAEEQEKVQKARNESTRGTATEEHDADIPDPDVPVNRGTRAQRQQRGRSGKDEAAGEK